MLVYKLTALLFLYVSNINATQNPIIEINNGKLQGLVRDNYYSFEGIPYAEPPIGENRFESPKPFVQKWNGIFMATRPSQHCIQHPDRISRTFNITIREDCLYLNIYTPDINRDKLYPVIFFIHGGAYMYGSGDSLHEKIIMKHQNLIYVTFNYRLNIFGFLSTSDTIIPGNMGLKDQRLALKWVKDNIQKFNGDPNKILLVGFSAGSASVEFFTLQSGIENLVSAAMGISGSMLNSWAFNSNPKPSAIKLGKLLNCSIDNSVVLKNCLKTKSAEEIVSKVKEFRNVLGSSIGIFAPVAENESVPDAIITRHPRELLKNGNFSKIPLLLSYTAEDGALLTASIYNNISNIVKSGNKYFLANEDLICKKYCNSKRLEEIFDDMSNGSIKKLTKFLTNKFFIYDIVDSINIRRQFPDSATYLYKYDNPPPFGLANMISQRNNISFGTVHGDDVFLIFNFPPRDDYKFRPDEKIISDNFVNLLEIFVNVGIPKFGKIWIPKITANNFQNLHIRPDDYRIECFIHHHIKIEECGRLFINTGSYFHY